MKAIIEENFEKLVKDLGIDNNDTAKSELLKLMRSNDAIKVIEEELKNKAVSK